MIKISVIIPVYNVEKYLKQCLDSVINQTYKNLEIICVNDASTDNSYEILKEYAKKDNRIIIVNNEKNLGLGLTRNHGMEYATGEYIHFLDSDDWMKLYSYEKLANIINKNKNIDVIEFSYFSYIDNKINKINYAVENITEKIVNIKTYPNIIFNYSANGCYKIFNKQFLLKHNMRFNDYRYAEDIEWSMMILSCAESMYFLNDSLYIYRTQYDGTLTSREHLYYDYVFKSLINAYNYFEDIDQATVKELFEIKFSHLYGVLWKSYSKRTLNFKKFRKLAYELNEKILQKGFTDCQWYIYWQDILNNPEWLVVLKYYSRKFTREHLPLINKILRNIRKNIKLLGKI